MKIMLIEKIRWLYFLLGFNALLYLAYLFLGSEKIIDEIVLYGVFNAFAVSRGMLWLLITSAFTHFFLFHFLLNMFALFQIGFLVEKLYTSQKLFITYIFGAIAGNIFTFALALATNTNISSLGASGAIFALLGLLIGGTFKRNRFGASLPFTKESFYPTLFFAFIISFIPGINWAAHLGGFLIGFILGNLFENSLNSSSKNFDLRLEKWLFRFSFSMFLFSYLFLVFNFLFGV